MQRIMSDFVPTTWEELSERFLVLPRAAVIEMLQDDLSLLKRPILSAFDALEQNRLLPARAKLIADDCFALMRNMWVSFQPMRLPSALRDHINRCQRQLGRIILSNQPLFEDETGIQTRLLFLARPLFNGVCADFARLQNVRLQFALDRVGARASLSVIGRTAADLLCSAFIDIIGENADISTSNHMNGLRLHSTYLERLFGARNGYELVRPRQVKPHYYAGSANKALHVFVAKCVNWHWKPDEDCLQYFAVHQFMAAMKDMFSDEAAPKILEQIRNYAVIALRGTDVLPVFKNGGDAHLLRRLPLCLQLFRAGDIVPDDSQATRLLAMCREPVLAPLSVTRIAEILLDPTTVIPVESVKRFRALENVQLLPRCLQLAQAYGLEFSWEELATHTATGFTNCVSGTYVASPRELKRFLRSAGVEMVHDTTELRNNLETDVVAALQGALPEIDACVGGIVQLYADAQPASQRTFSEQAAAHRDTVQRDAAQHQSEQEEQEGGNARKMRRYTLSTAAVTAATAKYAPRRPPPTLSTRPKRARTEINDQQTNENLSDEQSRKKAVNALRLFLGQHDEDEEDSEAQQPERMRDIAVDTRALEQPERIRDVAVDTRAPDGPLESCNWAGCDKPISARKLCTTHYAQLHRRKAKKRRRNV